MTGALPQHQGNDITHAQETNCNTRVVPVLLHTVANDRLASLEVSLLLPLTKACMTASMDVCGCSLNALC
jgi:hypothetical protein